MEEEKKESTQEQEKQINREQVKKETARLINKIVENNIDIDNIDILYKLVDIHKDISNEEYWKIKEEKYMRRYNGYNEGRYSEYGRRGVPGTGIRRRYRGYGADPEDMMEEMKENYMAYSEGKQDYEEGNSYNGEEQMVEATEAIMKNVTEIVKELAETDNPQVMKIIKKHSKKIMEM